MQFDFSFSSSLDGAPARPVYPSFFNNYWFLHSNPAKSCSLGISKMKGFHRILQRNLQNSRTLPLKLILSRPSPQHSGIHGRWAPHRLGLRGGVRRPSSWHGFGYTPDLDPARGARTPCAQLKALIFEHGHLYGRGLDWNHFKNGITDACSTANCCPFLTICPRHAPGPGAQACPRWCYYPLWIS